MINAELIERFLATDPRDIDCDQVVEVLHVYVEALAAGVDVSSRYPEIDVHLASCDPCAEEVQGLLIAVREADGELPARP